MIRHLKALYPTVPFIVMTANPDFLLSEVLAKDGVCDYLIKPFPKEKLLGIGPGRRQIAPVAQGPVSGKIIYSKELVRRLSSTQDHCLKRASQAIGIKRYDMRLSLWNCATSNAFPLSCL